MRYEMFPQRSLAAVAKAWLGVRRRAYLEHYAPTRPYIEQPLVLISQIQRSGGTLLSQLFDGHSALLAHPYELYMWRPYRWNWPKYDWTNISCRQAYSILFEKSLIDLSNLGYAKYSTGQPVSFRRLPFLFDVPYQERIFSSLYRDFRPKTQRQALNIYFTAFFYAWLDCQLRPFESKTLLTGFTPRVNFVTNSIDNFFRDYADGYHISIVRDPWSWFASARSHISGEYYDVCEAAELWKLSAKASLDNVVRFGPCRVLLLNFADIVTKTENTMRRICYFLGIEFEECLTRPTFNNMLIRPNSSFPIGEATIDISAASRGALLEPQTEAEITRLCGDIYAEFCEYQSQL